MPGKLKLAFKRLDMFFSVLSLGGMCIIISMQVFNRYVLGHSLDWSEELGRYLFIWAVYMGCSYAMQEDRHLEVTILRYLFGPKAEKALMVVAYSLTTVFCVICVYFGVQMFFFLAETGQVTPALQMKIYWVYLSIPVGMGLMAIRTVERIIGILKSRDDHDTLSKVLSQGV